MVQTAEDARESTLKKIEKPHRAAERQASSQRCQRRSRSAAGTNCVITAQIDAAKAQAQMDKARTASDAVAAAQADTDKARLIAAGLSRLQAMRAVTREPARSTLGSCGATQQDLFCARTAR